MDAIRVEERAFPENEHLMSDTFHLRNEFRELAAALRCLNRLVHRLLTQIRERVDRDRVVDEREHERQRDQREADEQKLQERARIGTAAFVGVSA